HHDPPGWLDHVEEFADTFTIDDFDIILTENELWKVRTQGIGVISAEDAISYGLTGPCLRGSGVSWDLRKARPYCRYDQIDFEIPVGEHGDVYSRFLVRLNELYQSASIIKQSVARARELRGEPANAVNANVVPPEIERVTGWEPSAVKGDMEAMINHFKLWIGGYLPPEGACYMAVESAKGELGYYFVSDGTGVPYRCHIRSPSFVNLASLPHLVEGNMIADMVASIGSIDIVLGEVDR
ncbi:MAG: NADH-quinone oxidoreductase subunit D, partial [Gammaproteobacteria bacterium]|nr:NADH-quinone oxidoreductase subunit D [Gammaproteobacteria bacterium]